MKKFSEFFTEWLYGDGGYYESAIIGKRGDFYTSVSASQFFGGSVANRLIRQIDAGTLPHELAVVEFGAHDGRMMCDLITFVYSIKPELLQSLKFYTVEPLAALRELQQKSFLDAFGDEVQVGSFQSVDEVEEDAAFVYANELFDAFACELYDDGAMAVVDNYNISFECADDALKAKATALGVTKGEISLGFEEFATSLASAFKTIEFVTFDYGEAYQRGDFSVRVYREHKTLPLFEADIKTHFKLSDITYDVNFAHLKVAFETAGFQTAMLKPQMYALLEFGMDELLALLEQHTSYENYLRQCAKAKRLISPGELGERFKCAIFQKGVAK